MSATEEEFMHALLVMARVDDAGQLERLRTVYTQRVDAVQRSQIWKIRVGMKVSWKGKHGPQEGVVKRIKQKYVECEVQVPGTGIAAGLTLKKVWNVPASMNHFWGCRDGANRYWICQGTDPTYCVPTTYPSQMFNLPTPEAQ